MRQPARGWHRALLGFSRLLADRAADAVVSPHPDIDCQPFIPRKWDVILCLHHVQMMPGRLSERFQRHRRFCRWRESANEWYPWFSDDPSPDDFLLVAPTFTPCPNTLMFKTRGDPKDHASIGVSAISLYVIA